jgi:hypothetical protein
MKYKTKCVDLTHQTVLQFQHKTVHLHKHNNEDANLLRCQTLSLYKQFPMSQRFMASSSLGSSSPRRIAWPLILITMTHQSSHKIYLVWIKNLLASFSCFKELTVINLCLC